MAGRTCLVAPALRRSGPLLAPLLALALALAGCGYLPAMQSDPTAREAAVSCDAEARQQMLGDGARTERGAVFQQRYGACMRARGY